MADAQSVCALVKPFAWIAFALAGFVALVVISIALACGGLWTALATNKDSIDMAVKILGLTGIVIAAFALLHARDAERRTRQLELQRVVFLDLLDKLGAQTEAFGKFVARGQDFVPPSGLASTLFKIEIIGTQKTVKLVLDLNTAFVQTIIMMRQWKQVPIGLEAEGVKGEQELERAFSNYRAAEQSFSVLPDKHYSAEQVKAYRDDAINRRAAMEVLYSQQFAAWVTFQTEYIKALDALTAKIRPVVLALRKELGIETEDAAFIDLLASANDEARKYVETFATKTKKQPSGLGDPPT